MQWRAAHNVLCIRLDTIADTRAADEADALAVPQVVRHAGTDRQRARPRRDPGERPDRAR